MGPEHRVAAGARPQGALSLPGQGDGHTGWDITVGDIEHTELLTKAAGTSAQRLCKNWDRALNKGNGGNPPFVTLGWLAAGRDI